MKNDNYSILNPRLLRFSILLLTAISLFSCSKVPAGHVGIKVYLLGTSKGVDSEELGVGRYWIGMNEELYLFPTFQQNYVWTKDKNEGSKNDESFTFQTSEGMSVNADVGISYHLDPTKISYVFQKYRKGIDEITDIYMRNHVRDAFNSVASKYNVEYVYGKGKSELIKEVSEKIKIDLEKEGIIIDKLYWIGSIRLPEQVLAALNRKIEAKQRAEQRENELRETEAEAKKVIAQAQGEASSILTKAQAQARANKLLSASLTPSLVRYEAIKKWDGKVPQVSGGDKGIIPFIEVK